MTKRRIVTEPLTREEIEKLAREWNAAWLAFDDDDTAETYDRLKSAGAAVRDATITLLDESERLRAEVERLRSHMPKGWLLALDADGVVKHVAEGENQ